MEMELDELTGRPIYAAQRPTTWSERLTIGAVYAVFGGFAIVAAGLGLVLTVKVLKFVWFL